MSSGGSWVVIDTFIFRNELELLDIRLHELEGVVDRFVLVEAPLTFTGNPKPLTFAEHRHEFQQWPITHIVVTDMPRFGTTWDREAHQRNAIMRGLDGIDDALILIGDADEIPAADSIPTDAPELIAFRQQFFYYTLRHRIRGSWYGTRAIELEQLRKTAPQFVRSRRINIIDGGWHFSYLGSVDDISAKLSSFSHTEYNLPSINNRANIEHHMRNGIDLFDRPSMKIELLPDLSHCPVYVQRNATRFHHLTGGYNGSKALADCATQQTPAAVTVPQVLGARRGSRSGRNPTWAR